MKNVVSKFMQLSETDFLKGLVTAILASVVPIIMEVINTGTFVFDWENIGKVALSAALGYLTQKYFTNSKGDIFTQEK